MSVKQPLNTGLPRRAPTPYDSHRDRDRGWQRCYVVAITLSVSALLATVITFGVLNFLLSDVQLPPQQGLGDLPGTALLQQQVAAPTTPLEAEPTPVQPTLLQAAAPEVAPTPAKFVHKFAELKHIYSIAPEDKSPRCAQSKICDGDHSCGPDNLGCVTSAKERQDHVRNAIAWAWKGYRQTAWGHDEVNAMSRSPRAWFNLGLTIVDSLDTLMIAGLKEEYQEARHWVANHLQFRDGSSVQFFEVNIRILGGLLSAYYLSEGDDMYLHKAQMLADRLMVAFNTSSGIPITFVQFQDASGRARSGRSDGATNQAEAGTISMEFTSIGRLLGRDDMFDAGNQFWYVLMSSQNFSGLYCMGLHTNNGGCTDPKMSIGSAADSMYEYMLKQWVLSGKTQEVPIMLYKEAMQGVRKHLIRHMYDGTAHMSFVSEATANQATGQVSATNDRFEHLTCFAGGMFILGALHGINTKQSEHDYDDVTLAARIGRACYEMYHQAPSGVAPDSIQYQTLQGGQLPREDPAAASKILPPKIKDPKKKQKVKNPSQQHHAPSEGEATRQHVQRDLQPDTAADKGGQQRKEQRQHDVPVEKRALLPRQDARTGDELQSKATQSLPHLEGEGQGKAQQPQHNQQQQQTQKQPQAQQQQQQQQPQAQQQQQQQIQQEQAQQQPQKQQQQQQQQPQSQLVTKHAPKPQDTAGDVAKPGQARAAPKPEDQHATTVHPGVVRHAPKPQDAVVEHVVSAAHEQPHAARRLMVDVDGQQQQHIQEQQHADQQRQQAATARQHEHPEPSLGSQQQHQQPQAMDAPVAQRSEGAMQVQMQQVLEQQIGLSLHGQQQQHPSSEDNTGAHAEPEAISRQEQSLEDYSGGQSTAATTAKLAGATAPVEGSEEDLQLPGRHLLQADDNDSQGYDDDPTAAEEDKKHSEADEQEQQSEDSTDDSKTATDSVPDKQDADGQDGEQDSDGSDDITEAASPSVQPSPPPPPPSSPPPPPPPSGPVIATWRQLSQADFLRPEAIETLFYLWRATGDESYREWGWNMFRGFERWCRLPSGGYATVNNVNTVPPQLSDKMESFFLAETLKYFYLLFEDDANVLPLDQWVLNTEAHPFPIWGTPPDKRAMNRLKQRRLAQLKEKKRREAEEAAVKAQQTLEQLTTAVAGSKGKPDIREGYGLAGLI